MPPSAFSRHPVLMLRLVRTIERHRAGRLTGLAEFDSPIREIGTETVGEMDEALPVSFRFETPDPLELDILETLVDFYGEVVLQQRHLRVVLRVLAQSGAVHLVQRVLWGDCAFDRRLTLDLVDVIPRFHLFVKAHPAAFFAEARAVIGRCRLPHQGYRPSEGEGERETNDDA